MEIKNLAIVICKFNLRKVGYEVTFFYDNNLEQQVTSVPGFIKLKDFKQFKEQLKNDLNEVKPDSFMECKDVKNSKVVMLINKPIYDRMCSNIEHT